MTTRYEYVIKTRAGYTSRDHLLREVAAKAPPSILYHSERAAISGGERALALALASDERYLGLFSGFTIDAKEVT